jgi:hypothetical protein
MVDRSGMSRLKETRRAITAKIRDDKSVACRRQQRCNIDKTVNVVGPTVQKNHRTTTRRTCFRISNIQETGIDLFQWAERCVRSGLVEVGRAAFVFFACALTELIKPTLVPAAPAAAMPKKRRRSYFVFSDIFVSSLLN